MKHIVKVLVTFCALAVAMPAANAGRSRAGNTTVLTFRNTDSSNTLNMLENVALNGAESTRTLTLQVNHNWSRVKLGLEYTYSAGTDLSVVPSCNSRAGEQQDTFTTRSCSGGTCTVSALTDTYTTGGADADILVEYDVSGCWEFQVVFASTGAGAGDLLNVKATAISGD